MYFAGGLGVEDLTQANSLKDVSQKALALLA